MTSLKPPAERPPFTLCPPLSSLGPETVLVTSLVVEKDVSPLDPCSQRRTLTNYLWYTYPSHLPVSGPKGSVDVSTSLILPTRVPPG